MEDREMKMPCRRRSRSARCCRWG